MFSSSFELSSLNGNNGFVINGIGPGDESGKAIDGIGDINGDGIDDLIVAARLADPTGQKDAGQIYVLFGSNGGFSSSFNLSSLNGNNGFVLNGIEAGDEAGWSVSGAGDVNNDGIDDLVIGALRADPNGKNNAGASYVVFGSSSGFAASIDLSSLNGSNGFALNGINPGDEVGRSVSAAGDINGDGIDDVVVGSIYADPNGGNSGQSYVVFGSSSGFSPSINLSTLEGSNGFILNGGEQGDRAGSVGAAGDINGDGIDDLIVGARGADPNGKTYAGESYVVFGSSNFSSVLELSDLDGNNGFALSGLDAGDSLGRTVSGLGDVNGDGIDDLIVGAHRADPDGKSNAGESYVVFGSSAGFSASLNLSTLDGSNGFVIEGINSGNTSGKSVSGAGDFNGDGFNDIIIGARFASPNGKSSAGESYIVFGRSTGFTPSLDLSDLDGSNGFVLNGIDPGDLSGRRVSGAGDVNGDGFDDVIIGGFKGDPNGNSEAGESYVVFGQASTAQGPDLEIGLYDADTDQLLFTLVDGLEIALSQIDGLNLTISAVVPTNSSFFGDVESTFIDLNDGEATRSENFEPYALFGDANQGNDLLGGGRDILSVGTNTIDFDLYSQNNLNGTFLGSVERSFTVVDDLLNGPMELDIGLYNAANNQLIARLENGTEIQQSQIQGADLTIAAYVPEDSPFFGVVESIFLDFNSGQVTKTENVEPYALFGDMNQGTNLTGGGEFLNTGQNTITLDLYSQNGLNGSLLERVSLSFAVV